MHERPVQAGALPNPMLKYGGMDATEGGRWPNTTEKLFMVEQAFPGFGKRELREQLARADSVIMQQDLETMTRDVQMMVKEAYFDLQAVRQAAAIYYLWKARHLKAGVPE
jgi:outer membrane protein TolC